MSKNFTAKQKEIVARKLGYDGPMQGFDEFLQSSPALAMKYGMVADKYMAKGGMVKKYQAGGLTLPSDIGSYTPDQKADLYNQYLGQGYSDADIRTAAGQQTDENWQTLQRLAAQRKSPTVSGAERTVLTNPDWKSISGQTGIAGLNSNIQNFIRQNPNLSYDQINAAAQQYGVDAEDIRRAVAAGGGSSGLQNVLTQAEWTSRSGLTGLEGLNKNIQTWFAENPKATEAQIRQAMSDTGINEADVIRAMGKSIKELIATRPGTTPTNTATQQYDATGRPVAGDISTVTAAQTAITPGMTLDSSQYTAGAAPSAAVTTAQPAAPVAAPTPVRTTPVTAVKTTGAVMEALAPLAPFTGTAPVIEAAQLTPEQMQAAMVQAQQLDKAQQVQLAQRRLQEGELVTGPTVDQQRVEQAIAQTQAAQGRVTEEMTVQGQLAKLTADFDTRNPPPWAAGAVRAATSMLAARGLGASSMAGQAIIQATMESAIPIASADAAVYQQMEAQNLSNRQQVAVLAAQQRAQFLGQEFDQAFQTRVLNAAKIADIANMNFSAEQQVYLENARLAQSVDLANLNNRQATVMANAATIANMQTANLSARQQSLVANAQNFLQMSMANMSNQQQVALFKAQELTQSIMSDAAAENSARQFNASNQQQADQFNSQITTQVSQFNALQKNAMEQFNAGQANALAQFNSQMKAQREEFNVKNRTIIDQANAQLLAQISLSNTAATNAANFENARAMNNMTMSQYNNEVQLYRDQVKMVFDSYERAEDRAASMATAVLQADLAREKIDADTSASYGKLLGSLLGTKAGDKIIDFGTDFLKNLFKP